MRRLAGPRRTLWLWVHGALPSFPLSCANGSVSGRTDRVVHEKVGHWPLSVSADRIALPAMRTFALLVRHGVTDRSGYEKFYEVYPAGTLRQWRLTSRGYKMNTDDHKQARESILARLRKAMLWLVVPDVCAAS